MSGRESENIRVGRTFAGYLENFRAQLEKKTGKAFTTTEASDAITAIGNPIVIVKGKEKTEDKELFGF